MEKREASKRALVPVYGERIAPNPCMLIVYAGGGFKNVTERGWY